MTQRFRKERGGNSSVNSVQQKRNSSLSISFSTIHSIAPHPITPRPVVSLLKGYILNIPYFVSSQCLFNEAAIPMASTLRVSTGSIIPSSHKRAVL